MARSLYCAILRHQWSGLQVPLIPHYVSVPIALTAPALNFGDGQHRRLIQDANDSRHTLLLVSTSEPVTPTSGVLHSDDGMEPSRDRLGRVIGVSPELPVGARVLARLADPKGPRCKRYVPCVLFLTCYTDKTSNAESIASALCWLFASVVCNSCDNCHGVSLFPLFLPPRILP